MVQSATDGKLLPMVRTPPLPANRSRKPLYMAIAFEGGLGLLAVVLAWLLAVSWWDRLTIDANGVAWGVAATGPMLLGMLVVRRSRWRPLVRLNAVAEHLVDELFAGASVVDLAIVSLLAGVGEELLFRGVLQAWLSGRIDPVAALLLASALFGMAHWITKTYAVVATLIGVYLGWLFLHFDNLLVPIVAHGLYDFVALTIVMRGRRPV